MVEAVPKFTNITIFETIKLTKILMIYLLCIITCEFNLNAYAIY